MDPTDICESFLVNQDFMEWNEVLFIGWLFVVYIRLKAQIVNEQRSHGFMALYLNSWTFRCGSSPRQLKKKSDIPVWWWFLVKPEVCRFYLWMNVAYIYIIYTHVFYKYVYIYIYTFTLLIKCHEVGEKFRALWKRPFIRDHTFGLAQAVESILQ